MLLLSFCRSFFIFRFFHFRNAFEINNPNGILMFGRDCEKLIREWD